MSSAAQPIGAGGFAIDEAYALVRQIACRVEDALSELIRSDVSLVRDVLEHTLQSGGKRLRPAFTWLAAEAVNPQIDEARAARLGACIEMIHMATLIHDDVIDHAPSRRGVPTAASVFGNTAGILSGDVLLARAMAVLAEDGDLRVIRTVSQAVVALAEGEVMEIEVRGDLELSVERHLQIVERKTASLIECCCRVGALIGGASHAEENALARFGHHVGMAFQLADDVLDYQGTDLVMGKARLTDYREGCPTLPLLLLMPHLSDHERTRIQRTFSGEITGDDADEIGRLLVRHDCLRLARARASAHSATAQQELQTLRASPTRELLSAVADLVVQRNS